MTYRAGDRDVITRRASKLEGNNRRSNAIDQPARRQTTKLKEREVK